MTINRILPVLLNEMEYFSKEEYVSAMGNEYSMSEPQIAYDLQKRLDSGSIIRFGWNKYTVSNKKEIYSYKYSDKAEDIVSVINNNYVGLNYQIFELVQLNEFVNHMIAHNSIFVYVENELQEYVFDTLKNVYPGRVMLRPSLIEYYRYGIDDEIVVMRLPSETPKGTNYPWACRLEKIIVDVLTDKLIKEIVPEEEKYNIVNGAYDGYLLDEDTMIRYAKRKGAERKFREELNSYKVGK